MCSLHGGIICIMIWVIAVVNIVAYCCSAFQLQVELSRELQVEVIDCSPAS